MIIDINNNANLRDYLDFYSDKSSFGLIEFNNKVFDEIIFSRTLGIKELNKNIYLIDFNTVAKSQHQMLKDKVIEYLKDEIDYLKIQLYNLEKK